MKECNLICGSFLALQDGDGSQQLHEQAAEHFDTCPHCRQEFQWYGLAVQALAQVEPVEPPPDFLRQLNRKLDELGPPSYLDRIREFFSFFTPHIPVPVGVSALVACGVLGVLLYNEGPIPNPVSWWSTVTQEHATANVSGQNLGHSTDPHRTVAPEKRRPISHAIPVESPHIPPLATTSKRLIPGGYRTLSSSSRPTIADIVGADNLTVESHTAAAAVESLKRVLSGIKGRVLEEKAKNSGGEIVLGVAIPSSQYGAMNSELLNHGALISGAGSDVQPPKTLLEDDYVKVYIRFTRPQP